MRPIETRSDPVDPPRPDPAVAGLSREDQRALALAGHAVEVEEDGKQRVPIPCVDCLCSRAAAELELDLTATQSSTASSGFATENVAAGQWQGQGQGQWQGQGHAVARFGRGKQTGCMMMGAHMSAHCCCPAVALERG